MSINLDVNTDKLVQFSAKLERLRKDRFPYVVRTVLNSAAFDVKQKTMPATVNRTFTRRNKKFFKVSSRVEMVSTKEVNSMRSVVGFIPPRGSKNSYAVKELEQQEHGGVIPKKSYIPLNTARTSKSYKRRVQKKNRLEEIKGRVVEAAESRGANQRQRFVKALLYAQEKGKDFVLAEWGILYRVNSAGRNARGRFKTSAIYSYKRGRSIQVKGTDFMSTSSERSAKKMDDFFIKEATKQFRKEFPL